MSVPSAVHALWIQVVLPSTAAGHRVPCKAISALCPPPSSPFNACTLLWSPRSGSVAWYWQTFLKWQILSSGKRICFQKLTVAGWNRCDFMFWLALQYPPSGIYSFGVTGVCWEKGIKSKGVNPSDTYVEALSEATDTEILMLDKFIYWYPLEIDIMWANTLGHWVKGRIPFPYMALDAPHSRLMTLAEHNGRRAPAFQFCYLLVRLGLPSQQSGLGQQPEDSVTPTTWSIKN